MTYRCINLNPVLNYFDTVAKKLVEGQVAISGTAAGVINFSDTLILIEEQGFRHHLRVALERLPGTTMLIGYNPLVFTQWADTACVGEKEVINQHIARLLFGLDLEAVYSGKEDSVAKNYFSLAEELLALFAELYSNVPRVIFDGEKIDVSRIQTHNLEEERLGHIWHAWHDFMDAEGVDLTESKIRSHLDQLALSAGQYRSVILLGYSHVGGALEEWLAATEKQVPITHYRIDWEWGADGNYGAEAAQEHASRISDYRWLSRCFSGQVSAVKKESDTPVAHLHYALHDHEELMAHGIAEEIISHCNQSRTPVLVVSNDRKHVRRLRSLLEAQGVSVVDAAGWTLSSTRAGAYCFSVVQRVLSLQQGKENGNYHTLLQLVLEQLAKAGEWRTDAAFEKLFEVLTTVAGQTQLDTITGSNHSFLFWIQTILEAEFFKPPYDDDLEQAPVQFTNIKNAAYRECDRIIFAGFSENHEMSVKHATLFLNQASRKALGLETQEKQWLDQINQVKRILSVSSRVSVHVARNQDEDNPTLARIMQMVFDLNQPMRNNARRITMQFSSIQGEGRGEDASEGCEDFLPQSFCMPESMSVSEYSSYRHCPVQYYLSYLLPYRSRPAGDNHRQKFGVLFHHALSAFHNRPGILQQAQSISDSKQRERLCQQGLRAAWQRSCGNTVLDSMFEITMNHFIEWYAQKFASEVPELNSVIAEYPVVKKFGGLTLKGRIDLYSTALGGEVIITEFKSNKSPTIKSVLAGEQPQVLLYALMVESPIGMIEHINPDKTTTIPSRRYKQEALEESLARLDTELERDGYLAGKPVPLVRKASRAKCDSCPVKALCQPKL